MVYRKFSSKKWNFDESSKYFFNFIEPFRQNKWIFDEIFNKFVNYIKTFREIWFEFRENGLSKIFTKIIEILVFEPHFRIAYRNFAKKIEQKFGKP